jgi:hypothetical protein
MLLRCQLSGELRAHGQDENDGIAADYLAADYLLAFFLARRSNSESSRSHLHPHKFVR